jgi:hypothetical protein
MEYVLIFSWNPKFPTLWRNDGLGFTCIETQILKLKGFPEKG